VCPNPSNNSEQNTTNQNTPQHQTKQGITNNYEQNTTNQNTPQHQTKQGITNTLALPIDKDVVHLPTVSTLSTPKQSVSI
jgi:hypothetical protein